MAQPEPDFVLRKLFSQAARAFLLFKRGPLLQGTPLMKRLPFASTFLTLAILIFSMGSFAAPCANDDLACLNSAQAKLADLDAQRVELIKQIIESEDFLGMSDQYDPTFDRPALAAQLSPYDLTTVSNVESEYMKRLQDTPPEETQARLDKIKSEILPGLFKELQTQNKQIADVQAQIPAPKQKKFDLGKSLRWGADLVLPGPLQK